ncbi:hypothetical protein [Caldimonas sp. KR1-144]|uniref:hypothetical protein n=1 Tax=Caldimonas sp. KR1-144 TaxID=3400911 RepID=UPI003C055C2F
MFELSEVTTLKLTNVSPRKECHGEDLVQAIDLSLKWETSNESLSEFDGWLRSSLYYSAAAEAGQGTVDGVPDFSLPNLRSPKLKMPLKWDWEGAGYTMRIDHGLGGKSDLVLLGCNLKKVTFDCREGGTVFVEFMVQSNTDITEKIVGKLCALEGTEIEATLLAPNDVDTIDGTSGHPGAKPTDGIAEGKAAGQDPLEGLESNELTPEKALAASVGAQS